MQRHGGTGEEVARAAEDRACSSGSPAGVPEAAEGLPQRRDTSALTPRKYVNVHSMTDSMRQVPGGGATGHGWAWPSDP